MIAGRIGHHAALQLFLGHRLDEVGGASDLKRPAQLEVLAFEKHISAGLAIEAAAAHHWRAMRDVPNAPGRAVNLLWEDH
jgi:hypothetical protein